MTLYRNLFLLTSLVLGILTAGCSSKNSDFFILNTANLSNIQQHQACRNTIMVERVKIAGYIDKPEIVTRIDQNQLIQAEFHRWAGPLSGNISDVIAENLALQLTQDRILTAPRMTTANINYYLTVKVNQFDVDSTGLSILQVTWSIYNHELQLMITRNPTYRCYAHNPNNYSDITKAMNNNITALSRDLALHLRSKASTPCLQNRH